MKNGKLDHCWGCGKVTPFLCARCHKPVCVVMFSATPDVGCGRLRRVRDQVGVFRLVHFPRCVGRRAAHVLAVIESGKP